MRTFAKTSNHLYYKMQIKITAPSQIESTIQLPSSKSICNRALILHALANGSSPIGNLSDCDDTRVMIEAMAHRKRTIDIMAAGTAMRFLTAFFAIQPDEEHILTGTERMQQRPIRILVEALRTLGADIEYMHQEGFPPILIKGRELACQEVTLPGNVSSQYISALLMIAPVLADGLEIKLDGEIVSRPYIDLTMCMMRGFGADAEWTGADTIKVNPKPYEPKNFIIENDWSAASYWFEALMLRRDAESEIGIGASAADRREKQRGRKDEAVFFLRNFGVVDGSGRTSAWSEKVSYTVSEDVYTGDGSSSDVAFVLDNAAQGSNYYVTSATGELGLATATKLNGVWYKFDLLNEGKQDVYGRPLGGVLNLSLTGVTSKVTVTICDDLTKKTIKKFTVKSGSGGVSNLIIDPAKYGDRIYVYVEGDKNTTRAQYTINGSMTFFESPDDDALKTNPQSLVLTTTGGSASGTAGIDRTDGNAGIPSRISPVSTMRMGVSGIPAGSFARFAVLWGFLRATLIPAIIAPFAGIGVPPSLPCFPDSPISPFGLCGFPAGTSLTGIWRERAAGKMDS